MGVAYNSLGQYEKAIELHQKSLNIQQEIGDRASAARSLANLGFALLKSGELINAEAFLHQGIETAETLRMNLPDDQKISIFEEQVLTYRLLQEALIAQNKFLKALEISERGRTRALVELLAEDLNLAIQPPSLADIQAIAKAQNATLVEYSIVYDDVLFEGIEQAKESALYIWVVQPTGKIDFRQVDLKPLWQEETTEIATTSFSLYRFWQGYIYPWGYTLAAILGLITIGFIVAIVYPSYISPSYQPKSKLSPWLLSLLAITSTSSLAFTLYQNQQIVASRSSDSDPWQVPQTALEKLVYSTREEIADSRGGFSLPWVKDSSSESLQQLHQLLIDPIADLLPSDPTSRVIFIPQRELFFVPFPALQDASEAYLIEKHTILTAPSIQTLQLTREQRKGVGSGENLIVGNPTMPEIIRIPGDPPDRLDPLEAAEKEAKRIAELLGGQPLLGDRATEMTVTAQMPNARIIHLATHGLLDDFYQSRIPGAIALAPDPSNREKPPNIPPAKDGLLTATEIYEMNLNAELVVLSACKTGLGRVTSDGMVGLSRSFFHAGVPSVLVSLWNVPDAPTADLMEEFYQNWQQNPDKAQALRQAMLATKAKHSEPKNWAGFALMGEAETFH